MVDRVFGNAGRQVLVEEFLTGQEISVFTFTDGVNLSALVAACDYKRIGDGDVGLNTGGMGAYSPPLAWNAELEARVMDEIMVPTVRALAAEGSPYRGVLFGGLMLTADGPKVIEFNARLGDPESQVVLPRMETDLLDAFEAIVDGTVDRTPMAWSPQAECRCRHGVRRLPRRLRHRLRHSRPGRRQRGRGRLPRWDGAGGRW